jgi:hypothetical protein
MSESAGGGGPVRSAVALVGGSPLPVYLAVADLGVEEVTLVPSESRGSGLVSDQIATALAEDVPRMTVHRAETALDPDDCATNHQRVRQLLERHQQAVLVYTGGTKAMAVAAELAWEALHGRRRDQLSRDRLPLHIQPTGDGAGLALVNEEGQLKSVDVGAAAPEDEATNGLRIDLERIVQLHQWHVHQCEPRKRVPLERDAPAGEGAAKSVVVHPNVCLDNGRTHGRVTLHFDEIVQVGAVLTFVRRVQQPPHVSLRDAVKWEAMRVAYLADRLGGDYAQGAVLVPGDGADGVERNLRLGLASPTSPTVWADIPADQAALHRWAAGRAPTDAGA